MKDKRPDFFLVGAPKSATTSMHEYMKQHSDIFVPADKEPHYFSNPEVANTYYDTHFVSGEDEYLQLFEGRMGEKVAGDFSPSYLFHSSAAKRIHAFQPNAKIIMILRNPIKRALSHYLMDVRIGSCDRPFKEYLRRTEMTRIHYREYVEVGMYSHQVKIYLEQFGPENVLVLIHDDFVADPQSFMADTFRFLGVDEDVPIDFEVKHNPFELPRSAIIRDIAQSRIIRSLKARIPHSLRRTIKRTLYSRHRPEFSDEELLLAEVFRPDVARLSQILDRDLSFWIDDNSALPT